MNQYPCKTVNSLPLLFATLLRSTLRERLLEQKQVFDLSVLPALQPVETPKR